MNLKKTHKSTFQSILVELVLLAALVGALPTLLIDGLKDLFGPCGFSQPVCEQIKIQGGIQIVVLFIVVLVIIILAKFISGELETKRRDQ